MKVYEAGTRTFENNGLGMIEPLKCIEEKRKSLNGWQIDCEVELKYVDIIQKDNIVIVETKEKGAQPFLINEPSISNTISFTADHIVFSCQRYLLDDVRPTNLIAYEFLKWINERTDTKSPFAVYSNIPSRNTKYFIRKNMLEALEETEIIFDGIYDIDMFEIKLMSTIGDISDVTLIYGKNIEGIKKWECWDNVCTKLLPVGPDELMLPEKYIESDIKYSTPYTRTITFDLEKEKIDGTKKTEDELINELRELAEEYIENNKYPRVNYTVTANVPQNLKIGDIIPVKHPIAIFETDVQAYKYDHVLKRVISIEYGNYERNVKKEFKSIKSEIKEVSKKSDNFLAQAKDEVYYLMNIAGKDGSIAFRLNENGVIYEIIAMDTEDISTAKTIMRLNSQGLAGTDKGINSAFNSAIMANGTINADMIRTGSLQAIKILGGSININDKFTVDENGKLKCIDGEFSGKITSESGFIGGFSITKDGLVKTTMVQLAKVYTKSDLDRIQNIIMGNVSPTPEDYRLYDIDKDGKITSADWLRIEQIFIPIQSDKLFTDVVINSYPYNPNNINQPMLLVRYRGESGKVAMSSEISARKAIVHFFEAVSITAKDILCYNGDDSHSFITDNIGICAKNGGAGNQISCGSLYGGSYSGSDNIYLYCDSGYLAFYSAGNAVYYNGNYIDDNWSAGKFYPSTNGKVALGASGNRWYRLYSSNASSESSDERLKTNITNFDERYIKLFEMLEPIMYNWIEHSEENKEAGLIAQKVQEAMKECEITDEEFGCIDYSGEKGYLGLIYRHFFILTMYYIQCQKNNFEKYKEDIEKRLNRLEGLHGNNNNE